MILQVDPKLGHYATPERTMARRLAEPKITRRESEIKGPDLGMDY